MQLKSNEYDNSIPKENMKLRNDVEQFLKDNIIRESVPPRSLPVNKLTPNSSDGILRTNDGLTSWLSKGSAGQSLWVNPSTLELEFFTPPHARVYQKQTTGGAFQAIATGTFEYIDWTTTSFNTGCTIDISGGDNSASNYIQVPYDGFYQINSRINWNPSGVPVRIGMDLVNDTSGVIYGEDLRYMAGGSILSTAVSVGVRLAANDKIVVKGYWDGSPGTVSTYADSAGGTGERMNYLDVCWLAP